MAKYSNTPATFFMRMPIAEFLEWLKVINAEIKRENKEIEKIGKKK